MRITIDYNNDEVTFTKPGNAIIWKKVKNIVQVQEIIFELLNLLGEKLQLNVELERIDEDTRTGIGEW